MTKRRPREAGVWARRGDLHALNQPAEGGALQKMVGKVNQILHALKQAVAYALMVKEIRRGNVALLLGWRPSRIAYALRLYGCMRTIQTGRPVLMGWFTRVRRDSRGAARHRPRRRFKI